MMKWKVVKNPRSSSAERSLECLKNDIKQPQNNTNTTTTTTTTTASNNNNSNIINNSSNNSSNNNNNNNNNNNSNETNNNVEEENKQDNTSPVKDTNRQRESSLVRKPSIVATECINLKSILGLTRQRSETNLSDLGLINTEPRRSRSEVRGVSCDRLTVGYHTAPLKPIENGKTRSSSPPSRPGWLRGRKRERESRNPVKNNQDAFGKTVVTGSTRKRTSSKPRNGDCRTIVEGTENKVCSTKSCLESRKFKSGRKSSEEDIIEEEIYCEINSVNNVQEKLLDENREVFKEPVKVVRKKGMAPKPQIATSLFKDTNGEVNLNPNGTKSSGSPTSLNELQHPPPPANRKLSKKNQTYNGRNLDKKSENRSLQSVKLNNLRNSENSMVKTKNNINAQSIIAVAEIHKEAQPLSINNKNKNVVSDHESPKGNDVSVSDKLLPKKESFHELSAPQQAENEEPLPFHIDTPDYSTLDSVNCYSLSTEDISLSKDDIVSCNTDCEESLQETSPLISSDSTKVNREISLSSILRDSSNENKEQEPKKTVRFEKLDLIDKYKKSKTENFTDIENDITDATTCDSKPLPAKMLDVNSNEIVTPGTQNPSEDPSQCLDKPDSEPTNKSNCTNSMTVNVLVRNPSPTPKEGPNEEASTQFIVKKSFVLTVAKQEKGFKSLCANKKPELIPEPPKIEQQQISVTFLCSGPPSEGWVLPAPEEHQRLRSISVPPRSLQPAEVVTAFPATRGRSRERRSKERQQSKRNNKARKKDAVLVMPQAVIDELSQVLEKRKPSLDEITVRP